MNISKSVTEELDRQIDALKDTAAEHTVNMVNIPSPPGQEHDMAMYVAEMFEEMGANARFQTVEESRENVICSFESDLDRPSVMLCAHFDTSITEKESSQPRGHSIKAIYEDNWIYGPGASNMKCAFTSYYLALKALQTIENEAYRQVLVTGVVGETERAEIDSYQGRLYRAAGVGAWHLVRHGVTADWAIIGEPTGMRMPLGHTGYMYLKLTVPGDSQHTWSKEFTNDPIVPAYDFIQEIYRWEEKLKGKYSHDRMEARVLVGSIEGGYPFKPSISAPSCSLYIDVRIPIPFRPTDVQRDLYRHLSNALNNTEFDLEMYCVNMGYEVSKDDPLVSAMSQGHQDVCNEPIDFATPNRYAVSSDCVPLQYFGIPSITYGPGGVQKDSGYSMYGSKGEAVSIDNILTCAKVYARAILQLVNH